MRWFCRFTLLALLTLPHGIAAAQDQGALRLTSSPWAPAECVRPECLDARLELEELEIRLGDAVADETAGHTLLVVGGVTTAGGLAVLLGTIVANACPFSIFRTTCTPQVDGGLYVAGIVAALIGVATLVVGGVFHAGNRPYRRRDGLRRRLERWDDRTRTEAAAAPLAITF